LQRYLLAFLATLTLYGGVVATYFFFLPTKQQTTSSLSTPQKIKLRILEQKPLQKQKKIEKKQKIKPKKRVIKSPKKVLKKLHKPKPKKIKPKKQSPKQIIKKSAPKPKKEVKTTQPKQVAQTPKKQKQKTLGVSKQQNNLKKIQQQKYFIKVKEIINENKTYPKKAKRRGISGIVEVDFVVSKDGELLKIEKLSGKKIFYKSVKKALKNSFPIQTPKNLFQKDIHLHLKLVYNIV